MLYNIIMTLLYILLPACCYIYIEWNWLKLDAHDLLSSTVATKGLV